MSGQARTGRALGAAIVLCIVGGCRSHTPKVDCDKHLQPINAPQPARRKHLETGIDSRPARWFRP